MLESMHLLVFLYVFDKHMSNVNMLQVCDKPYIWL